MAERKEGVTGGDGYTSPFGNGNGAPQSSGASDGKWSFEKLSSAPSTKGPGNPTREGRPQQSGRPMCDPQSKVPGGPLPFPKPGPNFRDAGSPRGPSGPPQEKPYKNAK
jgi:hypothetical protein